LAPAHSAAASPSYRSTRAWHTSCTRAAIAFGKRCSAGGFAKMAISSSGSNAANSAAVGSWPSRCASTYGELKAFSIVTCWSSTIPTSNASGLRSSSLLASASIGSESVMDPSCLPLGVWREPHRAGPDVTADHACEVTR
jgi:hypothetical protein